MKSRLHGKLGFLMTLLLLLLRVGIVHADYYADCDYSDCAMEFDIVCGSDGLPYPNVCYLEYESCLNPEALSPAPSKSRDCLALVGGGAEAVVFDGLDFSGFAPGGIPGGEKSPSSDDREEEKNANSSSSWFTSSSGDGSDDGGGVDPRSLAPSRALADNDASFGSTNSSSGSDGEERQPGDGSGDSGDDNAHESHDFNDFVAENMWKRDCKNE